MFDIIHQHQRPQTVTVHSETHEHRAPTDESVRLLKEMEQAATDKLLSVTRLENNTFGATWHYFASNMSDTDEAICRFLLNGQEHRIKIPIERSMRYDPEGAARKVWEAVTAEIAKVLTCDLFQQHSSTIAISLRLR